MKEANQKAEFNYQACVSIYQIPSTRREISKKWLDWRKPYYISYDVN